MYETDKLLWTQLDLLPLLVPTEAAVLVLVEGVVPRLFPLVYAPDESFSTANCFSTFTGEVPTVGMTSRGRIRWMKSMSSPKELCSEYGTRYMVMMSRRVHTAQLRSYEESGDNDDDDDDDDDDGDDDCAADSLSVVLPISLTCEWSSFLTFDFFAFC